MTHRQTYQASAQSATTAELLGDYPETLSVPEIASAIDQTVSLAHELQGIENRLDDLLVRLFGPRPESTDANIGRAIGEPSGDLNKLKSGLSGLLITTCGIRDAIGRLERL